jgi:hypothetical protein
MKINATKMILITYGCVNPAFLDEVDIVHGEFTDHHLALLSLNPLGGVSVRVERIEGRKEIKLTILDFDFELF